MMLRKDQMTSKERVLNTFAHKTVDRVPINFSSNMDLQNRLYDYYNLKQGDINNLLNALGVDFRGFNIPYIGERLFFEDTKRVNVDPSMGFRTKWIEHKSGGYWDYCGFPLKNADEKVVEDWPLPSPDDFDYSQIPGLCKKYKDYAFYIGNPGLGDILNGAGRLFGMERVYMGIAIKDEALMNYIDKRLEMEIEVTKRSLEVAQGGIDFVWIGEDLGTQRGALLSLDMYRNILRPRHQKLIDAIKEYDLPIMIHSCGSSSWAFEDFIEMGIHAVDTLQPEAANMSPKYLKENFGDKLAFHGCISTAGPVAYGTPDEVENNVRETLEIMMPGSGYCMAPTHALQDNSPTENVVRMYEAVQKYGWY